MSMVREDTGHRSILPTRRMCFVTNIKPPLLWFSFITHQKIKSNNIQYIDLEKENIQKYYSPSLLSVPSVKSPLILNPSMAFMRGGRSEVVVAIKDMLVMESTE